MTNGITRPLRQKAKTPVPGKPEIEYLLGYLRKMAAAFRVELSEATQEVYVEVLMEYPKDAVTTAFKRTIREWPEASKMPVPAFILERIHQAQARKASEPPLARADKPPGWSPEEARRFIDELRSGQHLAKAGQPRALKERE